MVATRILIYGDEELFEVGLITKGSLLAMKIIRTFYALKVKVM